MTHSERGGSPPAGRRIAVAGKGGSGKTVVTAVMTGLLAARSGSTLLAIDADSAVNLSYALGTKFDRTVSDIRQRLIRDPEEKARMENRNILDVMNDALAQGKGFKLLVMGRPEGPGCYCALNDLLRYGIERLSTRFDVTLIDCEAGPEQVNRRVVRGVDVLVIVTDSTTRGLQAAGSILDVLQCDDSIRPAVTGLAVNRWKNDMRAAACLAEQRGIEIFGCIPEDEAITRYDAEGLPLVDLPRTSPAVKAVGEILERILP
jgi:CO dehydrogenase maturation factor